MFDGLPSEQKDPRKSTRIEDFPLPEIAPDEAIVAVMASSINFNTVWTSIFEPLPTFGFLKRLGKESVWAQAPRPAVPRDGERRVGRGPADRLRGAQLEAGRRGHRALQLRGRPGPDACHDDAMLATNQRIWGFESNFGGLADLSIVKANQLMPKPAHLTWEEAAVNALDELHELPDDRQPQRLADDAGPDRAHLGRERRHRRVRVPVRAERRRHAGRRRLVTAARRRCCTSSASRPSSTARPRATSSGTTRVSRTRRVAPVRQEDPRARRHGPRHRVRAPRSPDDGRVGVRRASAAG